MSWDDHEGIRYRHVHFDKMLAPKPSTIQHGEQRDTLRRLAREYQEAGGRAYTRGDDEKAAAMREASKELLALADRLPAIPIETLTRGM